MNASLGYANFDNLRNSMGPSRPLLKVEQDLMSGIAGQIRNEVTIFMSTQDEVGDIYPRSESTTDAFGRRVESLTVDGEMAGVVATFDVVLHGVTPLCWLPNVVGLEGCRFGAAPQIYLATNDVKYHRFGTWDHRGWFGFRVRLPA